MTSDFNREDVASVIPALPSMMLVEECNMWLLADWISSDSSR